MDKIPLILFAGEGKGQAPIDELLEYAKVEYRALMEFDGKTIIYRILENFHKSGIISEYFILGIPENLVKLPPDIDVSKVHIFETEGMEFADKLNFVAKHILEKIKTTPSIFPENSTHVMFSTSDIPFLKASTISELYDRTRDLTFDLQASIVPKELMEDRFGETERTYLLLRNDKEKKEYCLGDITILNLLKVEKGVEKLRALRKNRKKVL